MKSEYAKVTSVILIFFILSLSLSLRLVSAWSNGGFSSDPSHPDYGTHDWIAEHALDWLPTSDKQYILDNLVIYLYGTELPDNAQAQDGIGDTAKHHIYFFSSGALQDDAAALRAETEYQNAILKLKQGDDNKAAEYAGIMAHYIADVAVFGHVMGSDTDWGKETHHSDYEDYVNARTSTYDSEFDSYLSFDGKLDLISAYNATMNLAYDTTFDPNGGLSAVWMDQNYDWNNPTFKNRAGESLNLAVNYIADVLFTLYTQEQHFFHPHTEFWFTWYDLVNAKADNIHFVNSGASTATITVYIAGVQKDSFVLASGQSTYRNYAGVMGGPVHIVSDQPIWCTQRIVGWGSFKEVPGLPGDMDAMEIYYTWYDMRSASSDAIHLLNPSGSQTAHVDVYIAGVKKTSSPIAIGPGGATYVTYPGEMGGPVRIASDVPIFSTQRIVGWSDFDEVVGMPSWYVFGEDWFNWYDSVGASVDNVHFINPGSSIANIQVYVGGVLRGSYALAPGAAYYVNYPGLVGGPVRVVSDQPIWCTQRIVGWNGFKEEFGVPTEHASRKWFFNWYDKVNAQIDNIHFLNPGSSDAHVSVTIAGTSYGPYTVPAGGAYYVYYPGVCNGPVIVESDVPIIASQRIIGWDSFEEIIGVPWG